MGFPLLLNGVRNTNASMFRFNDAILENTAIQNQSYGRDF